MGSVVVPTSWLGRTLDDALIKRGLMQLDPGFHFDVGGNLNIWHPYQSERQGVWHLGKHLCSMDRGIVPEFPLWSTVRERVTLPACELRFSEVTDPLTFWETVTGEDGQEMQTGFASVIRERRDKILRVGWRHTLSQIAKKKIPRAGLFEIEAKFGVDLSFKETDSGVEDSNGKISSSLISIGA